MDQENHQILLPNGIHSTTDVNGGFWATNLATTLCLPLARLASSTLNHHRIVVNDDDDDDDDDGDADGEPFQMSQECIYSKPFVVLDVIWNLAFVLVAVFVLFTTVREKPSTPLRLWIGGYALQCLLHVSFVLNEYQRSNFYDDFDGVYLLSLLCQRSFIKRLESINTVISSVWWGFGFYWIIMGGQALLQDSPRLYWLSVVFLAFDVFFMIFCIVVACIVFFVLFCCFPVLATVAYAMTIGEGASENDIRTLPKYRYREPSSVGTFKCCKMPEAGLIAQLSSNYIPDLALKLEDSECCICLHTYVDGVELCTLPCNHHFHFRCIRKWLRINATCPLCKCNIVRGEMLV